MVIRVKFPPAGSEGATQVDVSSPSESASSANTGADTSESVPDLTGGPASKAVSVALAQVGKPYIYGDEGPNSFDCSGLMYYSYGKVGVKLPRVSHNQANTGQRVSLDELVPGDLVFFYDFGHVGMYIGNGQYVHAPGRGKKVRVDKLAGAGCCGARRVA